MFQPNFTITNKLLKNIKRITLLISDLNTSKLSKPILAKLENNAREVSSFASTSIEGNPLPLTDVKNILKNKPEYIRDSEQEVLNYNTALKHLNTVIKDNNLKLSLNLILKTHKQVTNKLLPKFESGKIRKKPVVVNDPLLRKVVFLPPDHSKVKQLLEDLVSFTTKQENKIDPLIIAGLFHKQMAIIHPFMDGNGRTTRLITKVLLAKMGLNTFNLFSFENYYNSNVTKYFQIVGEFGDYNELQNNIDFTNWLEYFTDGIVDELLRVKKNIPKQNNSLKTRLEKHHLKLLNFIKQNNYATDKDYSKLVDRAKATRTLDFQKLLKLGLIERKGRGRNTHYVLSI